MPALTNGEMTPRQKNFVHEYVTNGFNGEQAAIDSGYSPTSAAKMAYENTNKPYINLCIREEIQKLRINKEELLELKEKSLLELLSRCMEEDLTAPLELRPQIRAVALRTIAEMNKMHGHYAPAKAILAHFSNDKGKFEKEEKVVNEIYKREY